MTRPAIVIGLGGTGQWVLTFLKKELLELGNGKMPDGVKLLCFDTTSTTTATTGRSSREEDEDAVRAGAVELTEGIEFIPIGDNVTRLATDIANGKHSHMQWFPAKQFLGKLPPAAFNTKEGSGQIRQMGRISLFRDLAAIRNSEILSRIRAAMQDLQKEVTRDSQLEIAIIGSLAGGTGAGMLVDIALLVRAQATKLVQNNYVVRGFFVLPRAFTAGGIGEDRDMLARSFAAWRELDRFMIVSDRFGLRQINYHAQHQDLRIRIDKRAYDVSYLVDPARQSVNSLDNIKAEEGLYPSLAHIISAFLDDKAGKAYTEFVSTNLAGKLAQLPRNPYHSAIGSYTLKVPVYYAHEKFAHELAIELLDKWLAPVKNEKGIVHRVSEHRNLEEHQGTAGWPAVRGFMASSALNIDGREIPNTRLMNVIADIRTRDGQEEDKVIRQWANGGIAREGNPVLSGLTVISQDDEGKKILEDINTELNLKVSRAFLPSRQAGDTPEQGYTRIVPHIPEFRKRHYGIDDIEGERLRGLYGEALDKAKRAQIERYTRLLLAWTVYNLNGNDSNPEIAKSGKIGYVRAFYVELIDTFKYFVGFLNTVGKRRRENMRISSQAKHNEGKKLSAYRNDMSKKCWLTFWDSFLHPDAYTVQRDYIRAVQHSIDVRKDDILLNVLAETALEMQAFAEQTLEEVDSWITHLARSVPGVTSLYQAAEDSLANVDVNHELDKRLDKVSELVGEHKYASNDEFIAEAMAQILWHARLGSDRLRIECGVEFDTEEPGASPLYEDFRRSGENPSEHNLGLLINLAERPYHALHRERPLAREIINVYENGEKLARHVDKKAEPMYMPASTMQASPEVVACYIRVHSDIDDRTTRYFREFEGHMKALNTNLKGSSLTLVDSEDMHKMTVIRSDDLVPSSAFEMWESCREAYIQQVTDPYRGIPASELHIFPAEINACYYEAEMPRTLRRKYRTLHPEVVALLEDREKFEMFFRAKALGFIRVDEQRGQPFWVYQLSRRDDVIYVTVPSESLEGRHEDEIFQVIHNFVLEGRDQRVGHGTSLRVDWGKLREEILTRQRKLGVDEVVKLYKTESTKGIVADIETERERRRNSVEDEALRRFVGQEHEDLADVARVVYDRAIASVKR